MRCICIVRLIKMQKLIRVLLKSNLRGNEFGEFLSFSLDYARWFSLSFSKNQFEIEWMRGELAHQLAMFRHSSIRNGTRSQIRFAFNKLSMRILLSSSDSFDEWSRANSAEDVSLLRDNGDWLIYNIAHEGILEAHLTLQELPIVYAKFRGIVAHIPEKLPGGVSLKKLLQNSKTRDVLR
jgi:hypothetical protein